MTVFLVEGLLSIFGAADWLVVAAEGCGVAVEISKQGSNEV